MVELGPQRGAEVGFLHGFATFDDFSQGELRRIVRAGQRVSLPGNWPLIHERTPGDACYLLLAGSVAIYSGRERIAQLGPGEVVGELSITTGQLRTATVSTTAPVELLRIDGDALQTLLAELPALRRTIHDTAVTHGGTSPNM